MELSIFIYILYHVPCYWNIFVFNIIFKLIPNDCKSLQILINRSRYYYVYAPSADFWCMF